MANEAVKKATAAALKAWRENAKVSQSEAATNLGVTQETLSRWENAKITPSGPDLVQAAAYYNNAQTLHGLTEAGFAEALAIGRAALTGEESAWQQQNPGVDARRSKQSSRSASSPKATSRSRSSGRKRA